MTQQSQPWWRLLTREHWFVFTIASLAWFFDCLDQQLFNLARDGAMEQLLPTKAMAIEYAPYTTSVFLVGWAIGGLFFGALGDRFGRARILTFSVLLYSVSTGLNALSTGFVDFCVYRFLTGTGVGGVFGLAVALVADTVQDKARAPALGLLQSLSTVGNITAGLLGMGVRKSSRSEDGREVRLLQGAALPPALASPRLGRTRHLQRGNHRTLGCRQFSPEDRAHHRRNPPRRTEPFT